MAKPQERYSPMDFEDSESETYLPNTLSAAIGTRKKIVNRFALLGWVLAIILFAVQSYGWIYPKKQTDLECTRQLSTWCK